MKRHGWLIIGWLSAAAAAGCAGGDLTLMQQELRDREAAVRESQEQLERTQFQLEAAQRENQALRAQINGSGVEALSAEYAAAMFTVTEVALHRLTGGIDTDGFEGDDALLVFLRPLDGEGDLRKAPGTATIELFDMALDEPQRRIGFWQFGPEETHAHWYAGLLVGGYRFELPWQQGYPRHADLTMHARFETPDGRVFAKTRQLRIHPLPGGLPTFEAAAPAATARAASLPDDPQDEAPPAMRPGEVPIDDPRDVPDVPTLFSQPGEQQ
jgi:hypothetical protein